MVVDQEDFEEHGFIATEDIASWAVGQTIEKVDYDTEHSVLALHFENGEVMLVSTQLIARGFTS